MQIVPANAQHIGRRSSQQDSFGFSELDPESLAGHRGFLAVLADGMGGMHKGDAASRLAVRSFRDHYASKKEDQSVPDALRRSVEKVNREVYELACQEGLPGDVGTTLVAVVIQGSGLYWLSVGDSLLWILRDRVLTLLNRLHVFSTQLEERVEKGEITREQAENDSRRDALTSYVGARELGEIDVSHRPFPLRAGDRLVLASDGVCHMTSEAMKETLAQPSQDAADRLVEGVMALGHPEQDNVTVLTLDLLQEATPEAVPHEGKPSTSEPERPASSPPRRSGWSRRVLVASLSLAVPALAWVFWSTWQQGPEEILFFEGKSNAGLALPSPSDSEAAVGPPAADATRGAELTGGEPPTESAEPALSNIPAPALSEPKAGTETGAAPLPAERQGPPPQTPQVTPQSPERVKPPSEGEEKSARRFE